MILVFEQDHRQPENLRLTMNETIPYPVPDVRLRTYCRECGSEDVETRPDWPKGGVIADVRIGSAAVLRWHRREGLLSGLKRTERVEKRTMPLECRLSGVERSYRRHGPNFAS